jgi:hypothetical protein
MSVVKLPFLVDLKQNVGEIVPSITSCPSIIERFIKSDDL